MIKEPESELSQQNQGKYMIDEANDAEGRIQPSTMTNHGGRMPAAAGQSTTYIDSSGCIAPPSLNSIEIVIAVLCCVIQSDLNVVFDAFIFSFHNPLRCARGVKKMPLGLSAGSSLIFS